jgi:lipopolysaccharide export system protein LptA
MSVELWWPVKPHRRHAAWLGPAALAAMLWGATVSGAPGNHAEPPTPAKPPVRIQSEQLSAELTADAAEFSGDVRVESDGYTLSADRLTIQFLPGFSHRNRLGGEVTAKDISRLTARGHVRIRAGAITASADQAVYEPGSGQFWLRADEGPPETAGPVPPRRRAPAVPRHSAAPRVKITVSPATEQ